MNTKTNNLFIKRRKKKEKIEDGPFETKLSSLPNKNYYVYLHQSVRTFFKMELINFKLVIVVSK